MERARKMNGALSTAHRRPSMNPLHGLPLLLFLLLTPAHSQAKITEDVIDVPVSVSNAYGRSVEQTIKVTVFRDTERVRSPT